MFEKMHIISMKDTDAAGICYFPNYFSLCAIALEAFLHAKGCPLHYLMKDHHIHLPVVHCSANYHKPLALGDEVIIKIDEAKIGNSSITINYCLYKEGLAADVCIVHVCSSLEGKVLTVPALITSLFEVGQFERKNTIGNFK